MPLHLWHSWHFSPCGIFLPAVVAVFCRGAVWRCDYELEAVAGWP
jgi:hypothetical protein